MYRYITIRDKDRGRHSALSRVECAPRPIPATHCATWATRTSMLEGNMLISYCFLHVKVGSTRIGGLSAGEEGMYRYIIIRNKDQASQLERVKHGMPILTRPPTT